MADIYEWTVFDFGRITVLESVAHQRPGGALKKLSVLVTAIRRGAGPASIRSGWVIGYRVALVRPVEVGFRGTPKPERGLINLFLKRLSLVSHPSRVARQPERIAPRAGSVAAWLELPQGCCRR
jgi:hypothetical protein